MMFDFHLDDEVGSIEAEGVQHVEYLQLVIGWLGRWFTKSLFFILKTITMFVMYKAGNLYKHFKNLVSASHILFPSKSVP